MQKVLCCIGGGEEFTGRWCINQIHEAIIENLTSACLCGAGCDKKKLAVVLLTVNAIITYTFAMTYKDFHRLILVVILFVVSFKFPSFLPVHFFSNIPECSPNK